MTRPTALISINAAWNIVNFRKGLIAGLQEAGLRVAALAPPDAFSDAVVGLGIDYHPIEMDKQGRSPVRDLALLLRYRRLLARLRPDIYLGYTIKPNIYGSLAAQSLGIPVINNVAGLGVTFMNAGPVNQLVRRMYKAALRRSRHVFFQNPDDRAVFAEAGLVARARTSLLPGSGIDLQQFAPAPKARGETFTFLLVSRLLWAKGIGEYAEAAARIRAERQDVRFRIAGILEPGRDGAVPAESLREWQESGAIDYLGALSDVRPALAEADCVVLPSYYPEGTPRSLLEAAASAKPLITCDVTGCREVVRDGVNGVLIQPRDAGALEAAMRHMLALEPGTLAALGQASRLEAEARFDERIVIRRYVEEIRAALSGAQPN
jgi:glycosyltransferase involved in cell wall biosynthesis